MKTVFLNVRLPTNIIKQFKIINRLTAIIGKTRPVTSFYDYNQDLKSDIAIENNDIKNKTVREYNNEEILTIYVTFSKFVGIFSMAEGIEILPR